jgi:S-methylmethionine-dependent homocysteine/selenocysteine methylase
MFDYEDKPKVEVKLNLIYVWMVVINDLNGAKSISKFTEAEALLHAISQMKNVEVERVFTVDEKGTVEHYDIIFKGKLKLVSKERF